MPKAAVFTMKLEPELRAEFMAEAEAAHRPASQRRAGVAIAHNDALLEKLKSNRQEVRARGDELYIFADADSHIQESEATAIEKREFQLPTHCIDILIC